MSVEGNTIEIDLTSLLEEVRKMPMEAQEFFSDYVLPEEVLILREKLRKRLRKVAIYSDLVKQYKDIPNGSIRNIPIESEDMNSTLLTAMFMKENISVKYTNSGSDKFPSYMCTITKITKTTAEQSGFKIK